MSTRSPWRHLSVAALGLTIAAGVIHAQSTNSSDSSTFTVLLQGARVGTEQVTVSSTAQGWIISSTGTLSAPFDQTTTKFELSYGADWQPRTLALEGTSRGVPLQLSSTF